MLRKMQKHLKDKKAFSLIEVIVSTVFVATLATTVIPQAITFVDASLKEEQNANAYKILDNLTEQVRAINYDGITAVTKATTTDANFVFNITPTEQTDAKGLKMKNVLIQVCPSDAQDKKIDTDCLTTSVTKLNLAAGAMWNKLSEYDGSFKAANNAGIWEHSPYSEYLTNVSMVTYMDKKFYIVGDLSGTPETNPRTWASQRILVYDIESNAWSDFPSTLPKNTVDGRIINGSNGKIYVVGGKYADGFYVQTIDTNLGTVTVSPALYPYVYDTYYDKTNLAHQPFSSIVPTNISRFWVSVVNNGTEDKLYILPGAAMKKVTATEATENNYSSTTIQENYIYNSSSNSFTVRPNAQLPLSASELSSNGFFARGYVLSPESGMGNYLGPDYYRPISYNNKIYFLNNQTGVNAWESWSSIRRSIPVFDPYSNSWDMSWKITNASSFGYYNNMGLNFINLKEDGNIYIPSVDSYGEAHLTKINLFTHTLTNATADLKMTGTFPEEHTFFPESLYSNYDYNHAAPGFNIVDYPTNRDALTIVKEANDDMFALVLPDSKSYGSYTPQTNYSYKLPNFPNVTPGLGLRVYKYSKQPNEY